MLQKVIHGHLKDNYTIHVKAKDVYFAEGEWTEFEVSMPKMKEASSTFSRFLENHPRLFPLFGKY